MDELAISHVASAEFRVEQHPCLPHFDLRSPRPASTASTPSSLASTPRGNDPDDDTPVTAFEAVLRRAEEVDANAVVLQGALQVARRQLEATQRQLLGLRQEASRHQCLASTLRLELECQVKFAQSEAASYRLAANVRGKAAAALQA
jgi:hypothetical protein